MIDQISRLKLQQQPTQMSAAQAAQGESFDAHLQQAAHNRQMQDGLQGEMHDDTHVAFSKHAITRAQQRGIDITHDLVDQLRGSMIRAQAKGATNILAMDTEKAFIINVPHAKVITAITHAEMKENIFTNIDGAVFL